MSQIQHIILIIAVSVFLYSNIHAQSYPDDFILTAFEDMNLFEYQTKFNFLQKRNYRLPLAEELEFRYSNDELTLDNARYQVRVRPTNLWKIRRTNALYNAQKEAASLRQSLVVKEALFERYSLMIQYFVAKNEVELTSNSLKLAKKKIQLFEQSLQTDLFDARNYVDTKLDMIEVLERFDNHKLIEEQIVQKIQLILASESLNWSDFILITPSNIMQVMNEVLTSALPNAELKYLMKAFEVARLETSVERADFDIGFVQAEYAPFKNNGNNELGFSFGFTVPIFKSNKDQIANRILDEIERNSDLEVETYSDSLDKIITVNILSNYLAHHNQLLTEMDKLNISELSGNLASSEDFDPFVVLKMEEGKLKLEQLMLKSTRRLLEHYLDFLYAYNALQRFPLQNYLSNDLNYIE